MATFWWIITITRSVSETGPVDFDKRYASDVVTMKTR